MTDQQDNTLSRQQQRHAVKEKAKEEKLLGTIQQSIGTTLRTLESVSLWKRCIIAYNLITKYRTRIERRVEINNARLRDEHMRRLRESSK